MLKLEQLQLVDTEDSPFLGPALRITTRADDPLTFGASARRYLQDDFAPMLAEKLEFETSVEFPEADWAPEGTAAGALLRSIFYVLKGCKWPVFEMGHFTASPGAEGEDSLLGTFDLPTRYTAPNIPANLLIFLARNTLLKPEEDWDRDDFEEALTQMLKAVEATGMMGINQRPLVGMLHEHRVPMTEISRTVFKAGVGPGSRLIRGSLTSSTDWCAATLVGNKFATSQLLRSAGLPVAECHMAPSPEQTKVLAARIGYPVVLKANRGNFGKGLTTEQGVFTNIVDEETMESVLTRTDFENEEYIIEKHVYGESYRVVVFDGKPVLVQKKGNPSVIGDGKSSVRDLMARSSEEVISNDFQLKETFDLEKACSNEDILSTLKQQGMSLDTVLPEGQKVVLLQGGKIGDFGPFLEFHQPDFMSKRTEDVVMRTLALVQMTEASIDFIGDDLNLPDPDFIICEINAGPAFVHAQEKVYLKQVGKLIADSVTTA